MGHGHNSTMRVRVRRDLGCGDVKIVTFYGKSYPPPKVHPSPVKEAKMGPKRRPEHSTHTSELPEGRYSCKEGEHILIRDDGVWIRGKKCPKHLRTFKVGRD